MQTLIQVICTGPKSLRDGAVNDPELEEFALVVSEHKRQRRSHGWAKIHMNGPHGAVNIEWHASSKMLISRVATRGGKPRDIGGAFLRFLLARLSRKIASIQVLPR
jgi:hypothetical protein